MKKISYLKLIFVTLFASVALFLLLTPGKSSAAAPLGCGLLAPVNSSNSDPNCLNQKYDKGGFTTCTVGNTYGSNSCESAGSSQATLKNNFIGDLQWYASHGQPYQRISADWIAGVLGGGDWAARINSPSVSLQFVTNYGFSLNSEYVPTSSSSGYIDYPYAESDTARWAILIKVNGVVYDTIKLDCGNLVNSSRSLPPPNHPPTGNFTALTCDTNTARYTIDVRFSDPDAATSAQLRGSNGSTVFASSGGTSANWVISTETLEPGSFPVELWVKDTGPSGDGQYKKVATSGIANCGVQGSISPVSCSTVSLRLWDQNDPDDNVNYYLQANGGGKSGPTTFGGKNASASTRNVTGVPSFDYWINNRITLWGVDTQTGAQTNLGTVTLPICGHISCGSTSMPSALVAGQQISFKVWVTVTGAPDGPPGAKFTSIKFATLNTTSPYSYSASDLYSNAITYTPQSAGTYNLDWTFGGGESNPPSVSCSLNNIRVSYEPYFSVVGGDVSAGQGFGSGCTANPAADIAGETLDTGGKYFGASSRQAAIASGQINQFASNTTNNIPSNLGGSSDGINSHQPSGLAFANTATSGTTYGGGFVTASGSGWCVPDYAGSVTGTTATFLPTSGTLSNLTHNADGYVYRLSGDQSINGNITLNPGVHVTVLVTGGNVLLNSNITYSGYASIQDIPQFTLIVNGGNLYIHHNVSELHGTYIAQPTNASNGMLFTCANGLGSPSTNYGECNNALTFYGAVSAREIIPGRMSGNLSKTSAITDVPGEQFVYTPELWLGSVESSGVSCAVDPAQAQCLYQSYTSLPPVL